MRCDCGYDFIKRQMSPPPTLRTIPKRQSVSSATKYVDSYLMRGENVVYHTRLHWAVFFPCIAIFVVTVLLIFSGNNTLVGLAVVLLVLVVFPMAINSLIVRTTSEFVVTNKRVLVKTGWIRRQSLETLLTKIESIRVEQGVLGRMLDYGTIVVSGTGGSKEPFHKIAEPMLFRRRVQDQISASEQPRNA